MRGKVRKVFCKSSCIAILIREIIRQSPLNKNDIGDASIYDGEHHRTVGRVAGPFTGYNFDLPAAPTMSPAVPNATSGSSEAITRESAILRCATAAYVPFATPSMRKHSALTRAATVAKRSRDSCQMIGNSFLQLYPALAPRVVCTSTRVPKIDWTADCTSCISSHFTAANTVGPHDD